MEDMGLFGGQCREEDEAREIQGWHFRCLGSEKPDDAMWKVSGRGTKET